MAMDLGIRQIPLKESEYRDLAAFVYEKSGIALGTNKQELMKTRLAKRLHALNLDSYGEYYRYVSSEGGDEELMFMINAISTNFTSFYREKQHFDFLVKTALPDILQRKRQEGSSRVRVWCAASSSGEEPYTIALTLKEFFASMPNWDVKLLATDISTKVLSQAVQGVYPLEKVKPVGPVLMDKYFEQVSADGETEYRVTDELRGMITFRRLNLMDDVFPFKGPFDFVMCRNVMIYFDAPTQERVVDKLLRVLAPGGYLLIGHSENLPASFRTRVQVLAPATYRKIK